MDRREFYRDGFRVWLWDPRRLASTRSEAWNNPVEHLSNNQVIGFIDIGRDTKPRSAGPDNREGLIQNNAVEDLRRLAHFVVQASRAERKVHPPSDATRRWTCEISLKTGANEIAADMSDWRQNRMDNSHGGTPDQGELEQQVLRDMAQLKQSVEAMLAWHPSASWPLDSRH